MTAITTEAPAAPAVSAPVATIAGAPGAVKKRRASTPSLLHQPTLIVLGRDDSGKPHASWFDEAEQKLAAKAAALMGMRALSVTSDEIRQLADRLPHGRVFASGRAFVPFVKETLFTELSAHLTAPSAGDGRDAGPETEASASGEPAGEDEAAGAPILLDWSKIVVGSLVLASEGEGHGWYECIVQEVREADLFILVWRDWPDEPQLVRRSKHIALLHPAYEPL